MSGDRLRRLALKYKQGEMPKERRGSRSINERDEEMTDSFCDLIPLCSERPIWFNNCTVMLNTEEKDYVCHYTWLETQMGRGASAVRHFLINLKDKIRKEKHTNLTSKIFSDSCGSQNFMKFLLNSIIMSMRNFKIFQQDCSFLRYQGTQLLPPDRIFGVIKKDLRKDENITVPSKYHEILNNHGTCR
ncbi:hypothetical protein ANN_27739 [Periplaneta americana]|uniref:Uncharacterized protein n=1 Tax=Periplaneta americana TaxID=6978 RepID=A0ABQ8RUZ9_PERAM|nr:hypothetical protein ANN_27739 [Periplaneta americana]